MRYKLSASERQYIIYLNYLAMPLAFLLIIYLFVLNNSLPKTILWLLLTILFILLLLGVYEYFEGIFH
jgi:hypothetical protein